MYIDEEYQYSCLLVIVFIYSFSFLVYEVTKSLCAFLMQLNIVFGNPKCNKINSVHLQY